MARKVSMLETAVWNTSEGRSYQTWKIGHGFVVLIFVFVFRACPRAPNMSIYQLHLLWNQQCRPFQSQIRGLSTWMFNVVHLPWDTSTRALTRPSCQGRCQRYEAKPHLEIQRCKNVKKEKSKKKIQRNVKKSCSHLSWPPHRPAGSRADQEGGAPPWLPENIQFIFLSFFPFFSFSR